MSRDPRAAPLACALRALAPVDDRERRDLASTAALLADLDRPFDERGQRDHVTVSAFCVSSLGVVLVKHRRLGIWLQPGGHVDAGELPHAAALRELEEETGVLGVHRDPPALVHVSVHDGPLGHRHYDCRWLLEATTMILEPAEGESPDVEWLAPRDALERCEPGLVVGLDKALRTARAARLRAVASWPS